MKIALYIEDGLEQIVLTPEGKVERDILAKLMDGSRELSLRQGSFYECMGGFMRYQQASDESTMIVLRPASADTHPQGGDVKQAPSSMSGAVPNGSEGDAQ